MKWHISASIALFATGFIGQAYAQFNCTTIYASTSTTKVPTSTRTTTIKVTMTSTTLSKVYTENTTIRPVYISVVGKKTTTLPTGRSFTPLISAPTVYLTNGPLKTNVARAPSTSSSSKSALKTTSYPKSVACSSTITRSYTTTLTTDATITNTFWSTTVSTSQVATSTAYAACGAKNLVSKFKGQDPLLGSDLGAEIVYICDYTPNYGTDSQIDCLSAKTCCEGAQRGNYKGYQFYVYMGANHCFYLTAGWGFTTIDGVTSDSVLGNGPVGSGVYQNITYTE